MPALQHIHTYKHHHLGPPFHSPTHLAYLSFLPGRPCRDYLQVPLPYTSLLCSYHSCDLCSRGHCISRQPTGKESSSSSKHASKQHASKQHAASKQHLRLPPHPLLTPLLSLRSSTRPTLTSQSVCLRTTRPASVRPYATWCMDVRSRLMSIG